MIGSGGIFQVVALAALAAAAAAQGVAMCRQADCGCQSPAVSTEGRSFTRTGSDGKMCLCICGSEPNAECKTDGQCVRGYYCKFEYSTADASFSSTGKCTSKCSRKTCPQFHECSLVADGSAACQCGSFDCDKSVVVPVCAAAPGDSAIRRFNNTCLYVNENCRRSKKGLGRLESFHCS